MAVRLSVILIQSRPPTANAQRMTEEVVGELIGFRGIDLVLVEPVRGLEATSTDRLTLGSLSGDVAVLDWKSPQDLFSDLASIEFEGERAIHAHDPDPPPSLPGKRKIYLFDLTRFGSAKELMNALSQLQSTRQVRTFTLGSGLPISGANGKSASPKSKEGPSAGSPQSDPTKGPAGVATDQTRSPLAADETSTARPDPLTTNDRPRDSDSRSDSLGDKVDLDSLIDELDQIDP